MLSTNVETKNISEHKMTWGSEDDDKFPKQIIGRALQHKLVDAFALMGFGYYDIASCSNSGRSKGCPSGGVGTEAGLEVLLQNPAELCYELGVMMVVNGEYNIVGHTLFAAVSIDEVTPELIVEKLVRLSQEEYFPIAYEPLAIRAAKHKLTLEEYGEEDECALRDERGFLTM